MVAVFGSSWESRQKIFIFNVKASMEFMVFAFVLQLEEVMGKFYIVSFGFTHVDRYITAGSTLSDMFLVVHNGMWIDNSPSVQLSDMTMGMELQNVDLRAISLLLEVGCCKCYGRQHNK